MIGAASSHPIPPTRRIARLSSVAHVAATRVHDLWQTLRRAVGDDAYERYLAHHAACHGEGPPPLDRRAYYLERQRRKWDGIQRCC